MYGDRETPSPDTEEGALRHVVHFSVTMDPTST